MLSLGISSLSADLCAQRMRIGSSNPTGYTAGAGFSDALFAAGETTHGVELWFADASGTAMLLDVIPGSLSSYPTEITRRSAASGNTWFVAKSTVSGDRGRELHYYPNLPANTSGGAIYDILPGKGSSHPCELTLVGTQLFFVANNGVNGRELWTSNGTAASTNMVKDILPGPKSSTPFGLISFAGKAFFAATTANGTELWCSDGTSAGTVQVKDIYAGPRSSTPSHFAVFGKQLFFAATTDQTGRELWVTDGTTSGTVLYANISPGAQSSSPTQLTVGSTLAFTASTPVLGRELYVLNAAGIPVRKSNLARGETIGCLTAVTSGFWFRARVPAIGHELFRTSATGISLVHDLRSGPSSSYPSNIQSVGKKVLFRASDGNTGMEYWQTDGVTATLLQDIRSGSCSSRPSRLVSVSSTTSPKFLFSAKGNKNGIEFYKTDGTTVNLVMDIDSLPPLPGMHWHGGGTGTNIVIDIKDTAAGQLAWIVLGTAVSPPFLPIPNWRGALAVDLSKPLIIFPPLRTNQSGSARLQFPKPPVNERTALISQAVCSNAAGGLEITAASTCNHGFRDLNPPNGPRVEGEICLDDESGEYSIRGTRTDTSGSEAFLGLYQKGPGGDLELIQTYPISVGEEINDSGRIEILLPLEFLDAPGRHLEMHLFSEEPTPESPHSGSLVVQSYC